MGALVVTKAWAPCPYYLSVALLLASFYKLRPRKGGHLSKITWQGNYRAELWSHIYLTPVLMLWITEIFLQCLVQMTLPPGSPLWFILLSRRKQCPSPSSFWNASSQLNCMFPKGNIPDIFISVSPPHTSSLWKNQTIFICLYPVFFQLVCELPSGRDLFFLYMIQGHTVGPQQ